MWAQVFCSVIVFTSRIGGWNYTPAMVSRKKIDLAKVLASLNVTCQVRLRRWCSNGKDTQQVKWCPGPELNRYVPLGTRDFKTAVFKST